MATKGSTATISVVKAGPSGRPTVEIALAGAGSLGNLAATLQKNVTRNADLLKKVGLKACPACISGFDIWIRHRFDDIIQVDLERVG